MPAKKTKLKLVSREIKEEQLKKSTDKLNDLYYILLTLYKGEELNVSITTGVLIKTLFATKINLSNQNGIGFLNIDFYPYKKGPFNKLFYSYLDELSEVGLIQKEKYNLSLTTKGLNLVQPLFEEVKNLNKEYENVETSIEKNLERCKNFHETVDKIHKEKLLDPETDKLITMQDAVNNPSKYGDKYIESIREPARKILLPNNTLNKLLRIEAGVAETDYQEVCTFKDIAQLLKSADQ